MESFIFRSWIVTFNPEVISAHSSFNHIRALSGYIAPESPERNSFADLMFTLEV